MEMEEKQPRPYITFRIVGSPVACTVRGQEARSLAAMIAAGSAGITALEVSTWALRLAHYAFKLRKTGLVIECRDEAHAGPVPGKHGRYHLHSAVEIIETNMIEMPEGRVAA